ncbi:HAD family hydrolase [Mycoplasma todarodis]|uniref:Cof-type HAD-IIB family hydrolase n=1 Tax=Mycoplasma todarodis TaxID=1937191 RepID=A0A4R0XWE8_9MOLU|nr:HAD family hydrolase [Mycoplasma todarodis]TCG11301.1 hypothetical protein C4B25_01805 [Mycoplasma todarodis]
MKNQKIKNINYAYFDLDGTLLTKDKKITELNLKALEIMRNNDIKIGIATGRPQMMIKHIINQVNPELPIISVNGGVVATKDEIIYNQSFTVEETHNIYTWLVEEKIDFLAYTKDEMYYNNVSDTKWFTRVKNSLKEMKESERWELISNTLSINTRISKFLILSENIDSSIRKKIDGFFSTIPNSYLGDPLPVVIDVMPKGISKGDALTSLDKQGVIDINKTMVFGDAPNDISMFKVAGTTVAVPNSHESLMKIADINLIDDTEDYIYNFIKSL